MCASAATTPLLLVRILLLIKKKTLSCNCSVTLNFCIGMVRPVHDQLPPYVTQTGAFLHQREGLDCSVALKMCHFLVEYTT